MPEQTVKLDTAGNSLGVKASDTCTYYKTGTHSGEVLCKPSNKKFKIIYNHIAYTPLPQPSMLYPNYLGKYETRFKYQQGDRLAPVTILVCSDSNCNQTRPAQASKASIKNIFTHFMTQEDSI